MRDQYVSVRVVLRNFKLLLELFDGLVSFDSSFSKILLLHPSACEVVMNNLKKMAVLQEFLSSFLSKLGSGGSEFLSNLVDCMLKKSNIPIALTGVFCDLLHVFIVLLSDSDQVSLVVRIAVGEEGLGLLFPTIEVQGGTLHS